jgi:hypothetical protein
MANLPIVNDVVRQQYDPQGRDADIVIDVGHHLARSITKAPWLT